MDNGLKKEKNKLRKELNFFLDYYKEVAWRAPEVRLFYDQEINRIIERLKEIGN